MKMKAKLSTVALTIMLLVLGSCSGSDTPPPPTPNKGSIRLTTDWSKAAPDFTIPETYTAQFAGKSYTVSDEIDTLRAVTSGKYAVLVYNSAEGVNVNDTKAEVGKVDGKLIPHPGAFYSSMGEVESVMDKVVEHKAVMQARIHQLDINVAVPQGDPTKIKSVRAELSGVASVLDLNTNELQEGSAVSFGMNVEGAELKSSVSILGTMEAEEQKLTLFITYIDAQTGQEANSAEHIDLSSNLEDFNNISQGDLPAGSAIVIDTEVVIPGIIKPETGSVKLTMDWKNIEPSVTPPTSYTAVIGGHSLTLSGESNSLPTLNVASYPLVVYNTPSDVMINGTVASTNHAGGILALQPGILLTHTSTLLIIADQEKEHTATMSQQVGQLDIELDIKEGASNEIQSITSELNGVASKLDFSSNIHSEPGKVAPIFTREANKLKASMRLLGVAGAAQTLKLTITFKDGRIQTVESDMTQKLLNFNGHKNVIMILKADLNLPIGAALTGTINNWVEVSGSGTAS